MPGGRADTDRIVAGDPGDQWARALRPVVHGVGVGGPRPFRARRASGTTPSWSGSRRWDSRGRWGCATASRGRLHKGCGLSENQLHGSGAFGASVRCDRPRGRALGAGACRPENWRDWAGHRRGRLCQFEPAGVKQRRAVAVRRPCARLAHASTKSGESGASPNPTGQQ